MCKFNPKNDSRSIDPCMKEFIKTLNVMLEFVSLDIVACCCGHNKYPMTIVIRDCATGNVYDMVSSKTIHRKRKFYKKDRQGYYFIPEIVKCSKNKDNILYNQS